MPIFEYQCPACGKAASFLVRNTAAHRPPACPTCGKRGMARLLSRFAAPRGGAQQADRDDAGPESGDIGMPGGSSMEGLDENDPRSLGRMMRAMAAETGETMEPEMEEVCRRLESGEDPERIEASMGDLLGDEAPGAFGGGSDETLYDG